MKYGTVGEDEGFVRLTTEEVKDNLVDAIAQVILQQPEVGRIRVRSPPDVQKLSGEENAYRVRVDDYRIVYEIYDRVLLVVVVKVGNRTTFLQ
ncbi:type II toxin-antitoxin system RelE family toxin [Argonema antarcticum]|uniref:type II toxin-antitoxin system RelE family toxin n=1 Tax=Argonema antarcticum TaxID=2942763 RepID=UPI0020130674|nr:type II toxin-antitoxin system RelE/ParE family toxin [Argonema antarcticum]MCL1470018.1 type II toxin-antitoxin system RelE/ParE family toxin [Argonema antarcticum A004/B2]